MSETESSVQTKQMKLVWRKGVCEHEGSQFFVTVDILCVSLGSVHAGVCLAERVHPWQEM